MKDKELTDILLLLAGGEISVEVARDRIMGLSEGIRELLLWLSVCPYSIDAATVPSGGIDVSPNQVIGNMSLSYVKYRDLSDIVKDYKFKMGVNDKHFKTF